MFSPAYLNLTIYQGSTFYKKFTWLESRNTPVDITGYTFRMQIRESIDSALVLAEFTSETGEFYLEDPAAGIFALEVPSTKTEEFTFESGVYDIECIFPDGRVSRIIEGKVSLSREVTR